MKKEIADIILGDMSILMFILCYAFGCLAMIIKYLSKSAKRDVKSPYTPDEFSWSFLIGDNGRAIILNLLVLFVGIVFFSNFFPTPLTLFGSFVLGLTGVETLKKKYLTSQNNTSKMEYTWSFSAQNEDDRVISYNGVPQTELALNEFAANFLYELTGKGLVTETEPPAGEETVIELITALNVSYIRRPIRKPKPGIDD